MDLPGPTNLKGARLSPTQGSQWTSTLEGRRSPTLCLGCFIPEDEGDYRFRYSYGPGASVDLKVIWPVLEQWTQVMLANPVQHLDVVTGRTFSLPRLIRFAVLTYQGNDIVVVTVNPKMGPVKLSASRKLTGDVSREFYPFKRLVSSAVPIASLSARCGAE